jgi:DNA-binding transcriptional LysR family regulator
MRPRWVSKFRWVACAPIVERQTTLRGRADSSAVFTASMTTRASEERYPLYAYYPSRHLPPAKIRAFLDFVMEVAARKPRLAELPPS